MAVKSDSCEQSSQITDNKPVIIIGLKSVIIITTITVYIISNPLCFLAIAIFETRVSLFSVTLLLWSLIHVLLVHQLLTLWHFGRLTAQHLRTHIEVVLNLYLIIFVVIFLLLLILVSNDPPQHLPTALRVYLFFQMWLSFAIFGVPCVLLISPALCY